jgi:geranylgeranyl pyrophosphate synthase
LWSEKGFESLSQPVSRELLISINNYVDLINSKLDEVVNEQPPQLQLSLRYVLKAGGKRIRPLLALLCCTATCGDPKPAISVAVAYELAHTAALIQDDIIDKADKRRGKPSAWTIWGVEGAILIADILLFQIFNVMADCGKLNIDRERFRKLLKLIGDSAKLTVKGELLELEVSKKPVITDIEYLEVARLKTGTLFAAPSAAGALVGGGSAGEVSGLYDFAEKFGVAYQIHDDIRDIMGGEETGEPIFNDIRNAKKNNIVLIYAMEAAGSDERQLIEGLIGKQKVSDSEIDETRRLLSKLGAIRKASHLCRKYLDESREILENLGLKENNAKNMLLALTSILFESYP